MGLGHNAKGLNNFTFHYKGREVKFHTKVLRSSKEWPQAAYDNIDDSRLYTRQEMLELAEITDEQFKSYITNDQSKNKSGDQKDIRSILDS